MQPTAAMTTAHHQVQQRRTFVEKAALVGVIICESIGQRYDTASAEKLAKHGAPSIVVVQVRLNQNLPNIAATQAVVARIAHNPAF